jgi:2-oxoisovalerate ferredoxin oxidoreductase beta subunit
VYIERCSLADAGRVRRARRAVRKALEIQQAGKGFAFVEFLSPCPTNMHGTADAAARFVIEQMEKEYPLGCLRDRADTVTPTPLPERRFAKAALDEAFRDCGGATLSALPDPTFVETRVRLAGFGGQGVLSLGLMVAYASQKGRRFVTWFPSYGPEQRGGTASCEVVVSGEPVGSPAHLQVDVLIALNGPSLQRFGAAISPGGLILYEASIGQYQAREDVTALAVPAVEIATAAGIPKAANAAMLGTLAATRRLELPAATFREALTEAFAARPQLVAPNCEVFDAAVAWASAHTAIGTE